MIESDKFKIEWPKHLYLKVAFIIIYFIGLTTLGIYFSLPEIAVPIIVYSTFYIALKILLPKPSPFRAASIGRINIVQKAIKRGDDINEKDSNGNTMLHVAAAYEQVEVAKILLDHGADIESVNNLDLTPLETALLWQSKNVAEFFQQQGAKRSLQAMIMAGDLQGISEAVENDESILNKQKPEEYLSLISAVHSDQIKVLEYLLDQGVSADALSKSGHTALHFAAQIGRPKIAEILIEKGGADLNKKDKDGVTPLFWAAFKGQNEMVEILLKYGAQFTIHIAAMLGDKKRLLDFLASDPDSVNAESFIKGTPLIFAVFRDQEEMVKILLEKGADPDIKTTFDDTPLELAKVRKNKKIIRLLKKAKKKQNPTIWNQRIFGRG